MASIKNDQCDPRTLRRRAKVYLVFSGLTLLIALLSTVFAIEFPWIGLSLCALHLASFAMSISLHLSYRDRIATAEIAQRVSKLEEAASVSVQEREVARDVNEKIRRG